ncbi:MAG TPA: vitamin B12 dependent-methionine synthase activation domain-containing protein [Prolixibacteraceae bacterium]
MINEFSYSFNELDVNPAELAELLGYPDGVLPEPFSEYLSEAMKKAETLGDIRGAFYKTNDIRVSVEKDKIILEGVDFAIGKTVAKELRNSESMILFVCTAGKEISDLAQNLLMGDDPVLGYVYNVLGSLTVEAVADKIHQEIKDMAALSGELITNRYSPGYCQWSVGDQHKLFSFFPEKCCGISLTDSALMQPIKSVSGFIGMGKVVKFRKYTCDLCRLTNCFYRNRQKEIETSLG